MVSIPSGRALSGVVYRISWLIAASVGQRFVLSVAVGHRGFDNKVLGFRLPGVAGASLAAYELGALGNRTRASYD